MAKGQQRKNKETKKPKQEKKPASVTWLGFGIPFKAATLC